MKNVMLVDDHPAIRLAVRSVLEKSDRFNVTHECDNGQQALETIRLAQIDLMIIDLDLPRISGLELIQRARNTQSSIKLLVLSAQDEEVYATRAMQAGADGYVSKTRDLNAIVSAADAVLEGYSYFPHETLLALKTGAVKPISMQIATLSDRELSVLQHLAKGFSNKEIADLLYISNKTVSTYKTNILSKLGLSSVVELVDFARQNKLI
ncbi:response regulator transcription factor [Neisseriaceae bacterium TC5R-5]|nr:response regulator transcription factor [Neisseriaceae bacterium TC5R-5]